MTKQSPAILLGLCAALGVACSETTFEPESPAPPPHALAFTLEVQPTVAELFATAPGNWLPLSIEARDLSGAKLPFPIEPTYSSSAPEIAQVSSTGLVTAAAPGTAVITASLTLGATTRTAVVTVTVYGDDPFGSYPPIAGVYYLTALITSSDPVWGIEDGSKHTATLTIGHSPTAPQFTGTFANFRAISPGGDTLSAEPGVVRGNITPGGRVVISLFYKGSQTSSWDGWGTLGSSRIAGTFFTGGHISGTFTAERRPQ